MPERAELPAGQYNDKLGLERIALFSDAVIAIAITLLAIDLRLPEIDHQGVMKVPLALFEIGPELFSFLLSFIVIASYWVVHHRVFRVITRYDDRLLWFNIAFLLCIVFLPFASDVLGEYEDFQGASVFYALCIAVTGFTEAALWVYATRGHRLIDRSVSERHLRFATYRALIVPTVFLVSIPVILISHIVGGMFWLSALIILWVLYRIELRAPAPKARPAR